MFTRILGGVFHLFSHVGVPEAKILELLTEVPAKIGEFGSLAVGATMEIGRTDLSEEGREIELALTATRKS